MSRAPRLCSCGSGQLSHWQYDADGIELCRTCPQCHQRMMGRYRPDIKTVSSRDYGETVESEEY